MAKSSLLKDTVNSVKACPREIFNVWLFFCTAVWSFSGVAKGFDEGELASITVFQAKLIMSRSGNIASIVTQKKFKKDFGVDHESEAQYASRQHFLCSCKRLLTSGQRYEGMDRSYRDSWSRFWLSSLRQSCPAMGKEEHHVGIHFDLHRRCPRPNILHWQSFRVIRDTFYCRQVLKNTVHSLVAYVSRYWHWYHNSSAFNLPYRGSSLLMP